ncbi:hypothetical protein GJ496_006051 [Pomphorhynchus laevis]|nr:hypothetical protein GJ496_006051 [Pomphorhynchus laevis]
MAQLYSSSYSQSQSLQDVQIDTVYADGEGREQNHSTNYLAFITVTTKVCFFCGRDWYLRSACPTRNSTCNGCGKVGHFSKVCRSKPKQKSRINMIDTHHNDSCLTTVMLKSMVVVNDWKNIQEINLRSLRAVSVDKHECIVLNTSNSPPSSHRADIFGKEFPSP